MTLCQVERRDADPRYDYREDTFDMAAPRFPPQCGHAACIEDEGRCLDWHEWGCAVARCRVSVATAVCDLEAGHDGAHVFSDEAAS